MGTAGTVMGRAYGKRGSVLRQAVIVAGGRGSRLGAIAADTPKPLLDVGGRPFVEHLLFELGRIGIEEVLLLVGPHRAAFQRALRPARRTGPKLVLVPEPKPAGTAGALWHARKRLAPRFLFLNGDSILDANLLRLVGAANSALAGAVAALEVPDSGRYGRIECAGDRISAFREKGASGPGLINAGIYVFAREQLLAHIAKPPCSLEHDVLPALAAERGLRAIVCQGRFIDIGLPESLAEARGVFPAWHRRPAAIVELDALVPVGRSGRIRWRMGSVAALRRLNDAGYYVIILAPGRAERAGKALRRRLNASLQPHAAHIDALYAGRASLDALLAAARADWPLAEQGSFLVTAAPHIIAQTEPYLAIFRATSARGLDGLVGAALDTP